MTARLDWARDGRDWPHRDASRFVEAGGIRWHVQTMGRALGDAPVMLLLHGTGSSTHSWAGLADALDSDFAVVAPDLPGHAFTSMPPPRKLSLPGMAGAVGDLLAVLGVRPDLVVGHSAGAAVAARMCLDGRVEPRLLVAVNGALLPLHGFAGQLFSPVAKLLAISGWAPRFFAWQASHPQVLRRLLEGTGSTLDERGASFYGRLVANEGHVAGALGMMANWDLQPLAADLPRLKVPLLLMAGERDLTLPADHSRRAARLVPGARFELLPGLGHIAHEERPDLVAGILRKEWEHTIGGDRVVNLS